MPRLPRLIVPMQPHHVVQRGHDKSPIFFEDEDYEVFKQCLKTALGQSGCALHAYVLMTNHYHLMVTPPDEGALSSMIQTLGRLYVGYINAKYNRRGTLWEGRFKASVIDAEDYLFACMRYIESNPVRAGLSRRAMDYPWSSHGRNGWGKPDDLILSHRLYVTLGSTPEARTKSYRDLFQQEKSADVEDMIRVAGNGGWAVGSEKFRNKIERMTGRRATAYTRGGDRRSEKFLAAG